jgi:hypothetical protein
MKPFISLARPARFVRRRRARCLIAERLDDRTLLSTFSVSNTDDHGPGSLRQAIVDANDNAKTRNSARHIRRRSQSNVAKVGVRVSWRVR